MLGYYATRDLIPLYAIYSLLFADHGLSVGQISSLFVIWSVVSFVFEVPSGAWADTVDRRLLLVLSGSIYAAGFSAWMLWPTYVGFALGFVSWGLSSAIMSGTFEALLYDELTAQGRPGSYAQIKGWRKSPLGLLYYPNYFNDGVAIHGSLSVPPTAASHGCVRIPHYADKAFSGSVWVGMEVLVYD